MTTFDRFDPFERRITDAIDEIAGTRPPEYLNDILRQTARRSQRPRWTFPERWLPVNPALLGAEAPHRNATRLLLVLALLAALATAAWAGGRLLERPDPPLPAPFGPARNGLVAFSTKSDVFLGDPRTGSTRLFAAGVGSNPIFDRSGTRMATSRTNPAGVICYAPTPVPACTVDIVVTGLDGRFVTVTHEPLQWPALVRDWSSDGRWMLVTAGPSNAIELVAADGSGTREISAFPELLMPRFAPPDGVTIWTDERAGLGGFLPMRMGLDGQALTRFTALPGRENLSFDAAPDGQRIAFGGDGSNVVIARLDSSVERSIDLGPDVEQVVAIAWSPAADRLAVEVRRGAVHSVVLVDPLGVAPAQSLDPRVTGSCTWAPDGESLVCAGEDIDWFVVDQFGGVRLTEWRDLSYLPSWQRLAPEDAPE